MKAILSAAIGKAAQLTRRQNLVEATRVIQRALSGQGRAQPPVEPAPAAFPRVALRSLFVESAAALETPVKIAEVVAQAAAPAEQRPIGRVKRPLGEVLELLRQADLPDFRSIPKSFARAAPPASAPEGAVFLSRSFACEAGSRDYKVYVPSHIADRPPAEDGEKPPLIVMLHGCAQTPDDFAAGTGMNLLAEEHGFIVAYPRQSTSANQTACWNWFNPGDQMRDAGEPSIIAGMTRSLIADFGIDAERVYVAGLSAGGAMAAIMSATYPELYDATGIHSGLAHGAASDLLSALTAMRGRFGSSAAAAKTNRSNGANGGVRTIVFHGGSDQTVHPSNAEAIVAAARAGLKEAAQETQPGRAPGGRAYTRTVIADASGAAHVEYWAIQGLGHAWSGGQPGGSYTDPQGPDASREMLRFFLNAPAPSRAH